MNYTVATTAAKKVTVSITRKQLWDNYVDCWRDSGVGGGSTIDHLKNVHSVLVTASPLDFVKLRNLFRSGDTVMFMGDAMQFIDFDTDNGVDILREIIVVDHIHKNVTIRHEDINF
jgi:hypothetical protein